MADDSSAALTVDAAAARSGMTPDELIAESRAMDVVDALERAARDSPGYLGSQYIRSRRAVVVNWVAGQVVPDGVEKAGTGTISVEIVARDTPAGVGQWMKDLGRSRPPLGIGAISFDHARLRFVVSVKTEGPYASATPARLRELLGLPAPVVDVKHDAGLGGALSRSRDGVASNPSGRVEAGSSRLLGSLVGVQAEAGA